MKILNIRVIPGPNVYHYKPVLIMKLNLESLTERASTDCPGFSKRLIKTLPELREHRCSPGHIGGFIERLERGTYFAHIVEHVALALSEKAGIGVGFGKAVYGGAPGLYEVIIRYHSEQGMMHVLKTAVALTDALVEERPFDLDKEIEEIKRTARSNELGPSTQALIAAAEEREIPWRRVDERSLIQLGQGKYRRFIQATTTSLTSDIAVEVAQDKGLTKKFLEEASLPVPRGRVVESKEEALMALEELKGPVALKPYDGNHGRGVFLNLKTHEEVSEAYDLALKHSSFVLVEECFHGEDYRVALVDGKLVAAAHRVPAHVMGDGVHTIEELVEKENQNPLRGEGHEKPLTLIKLDDEAMNFLHRQNIALQSVPAKGVRVCLRETANLSTGGMAHDVTDEVHEDVRQMCERAARIVGLDVCGIDLVLEDIKRPLHSQKGGIIEINAGPGIRMHHFPTMGKARDVAGAIIESMFKESPSGRIPIVAVTGTNGKTTVTRLISNILQSTGLYVGTTTTDGIFINGQRVVKGDTTGPHSARTVLSDPAIEAAVLETARGGIMRRGLGFDWCDVGIITNIQPDHIGQDGLESLEDILKVKTLVVERVRTSGAVVLNADSEELVKYVSRNEKNFHSRRLIYFSMDQNSQVLADHTRKGGTGYFARNGRIFECTPDGSKEILDAASLPLTMAGTAKFQIANVMTVIAATRALNVPLELIIEELRSFNQNDNPGRLNLYQLPERGHVLLDYGHNPDAFLSIGEMVKSWGDFSVTGVIGTPGDRSDSMIGLSGTAAANVFDKVIIREDDDLRGRAPGMVANILRAAILKEKRDLPCEIVPDAMTSLERAIEGMKENEVVVYFYEDLGKTLDVLSHYGARMVTHIGPHSSSFEQQLWMH